MNFDLILASGSPRRKEILERQGIKFTIIKSDCEENTRESEPDKVVMDLSRQKALDVIDHKLGEVSSADRVHLEERASEVLILSADTVVACDGKILGKPKDAKEAHEMLRLLSGREHQVYTGVTMLSKDKTTVNTSFAVCTNVYFYDLTDEEIEAYIATGDPLDKAGSYGIQGIFGVHVKGIEGDYDNVVGLPIAEIYQTCKKQGIRFNSFGESPTSKR